MRLFLQVATWPTPTVPWTEEEKMDHENVVHEVISWLDNVNKFRLRQVSKAWNRVILASFRFC